MTLQRYINCIIIALLAALTACEDKLPFDDQLPGEGMSCLDMEISLHSLDPALHSRSAGNAVENIDNLWVVMFQVDGEGNTSLFRKILASGLPGYEVKNVDDTGGDSQPDDAPVYPGDVNFGGNIEPVADSTPRATFKINGVPYGRYKIYAVANIDNLPDDICMTEDDLRSYRCEWKTDVKEDNQMFGFFTLDDKRRSGGFEADIITVKDVTLSLHSWIRRLVSKVTVSFDVSELKESVRVYVKSITIRDIPMACTLGKYNTPLDPDSLISEGESFKFYTAATASNADHEKWSMVLSKGSGPKGEVSHSETDRALYFYENMQGNWEGKGEDYLKSQITDEDSEDRVGSAIDEPGTTESGKPNDFKDRIKYGTYIEVEAYYDSRNKDKISQGPIKYRFMLGKNITYNYDAERNYHYKLTLKLRGYANEADWHIHYKEYIPTLITPEPYYISYLYDQEMDFPARVILPDDWDKSKYFVKAEIVENNWWPWDRALNDSTGGRPSEYVGPATDINGFAWNQASLANFPAVTYDSKTYNGNPYQGGNYVGFLSLRPNKADIIGTDAEVKAYTGALDQYGYGTNANKYLQHYYESNNLAVNSYELTGSEASLNPIDGSVRLKIPMYTRNKEMVPSSDFTANNPFNCYSRYAKVRFTLWSKDTNKPIDFKNEEGEWETERLATIYQVQRIENPKAIYRDAGNDDEFEIKLMILPQAGTSTYQTFKSDGPWRASIMCQSEEFIELIDRNGRTRNKVGEYIEGHTDETIEFKYKPKGTIADNRTRSGIIKVEYHDYNCVHLIFVRQGYHAGVQLGNAKWSCYNVYATSRGGNNRDSYAPGDENSVPVALTRSPLSVGSLYKRNQYNYGIREENNKSYGWLKSITDIDLSTAYITSSNTVDTRGAQWKNIQGYGWTNFKANATMAQRYSKKWADTWTAKGGFRDNEEFSVPTADNFNSLLANCKFGYGIVYADGAKTTQTEFSKANGFTDYDNDGKDDVDPNNSRGVRACVVYDESDGKNIIFPLGATGQTRRPRTAPYGNSSAPFADPGAGALSYGGMRQVLTGTNNRNRPLTYNLYRSPGALYWIKEPVTKAGTKDNSTLKLPHPDYAVWDINYFTLVFNPHDSGSLGGWDDTNKKYDKSDVDATTCSDACAMKLIYKN